MDLFNRVLLARGIGSLFLGIFCFATSFKPSFAEENVELNVVALDPASEKNFQGLWDSANLDEILTKFRFFSKKCHPYDPLNFGVVLNNKHHKIYRSKALGKRGVEELFAFMESVNLDLPSTVIFMNKEGYKTRFLGSVVSPLTHVFNGITPFVYEQAQIFAQGGKYPGINFYHPLNSQVFLSGHDPLNDVVSQSIEGLVEPEIQAYFDDEIKDQDLVNIIASRSSFFNALELVLASKGPVLFHCTGGLHRTGMIAMAIRYMQGGVWIKPFNQDLEVETGVRGRASKLQNLAEVEYYLHNRLNFRSRNLRSIRKIIDNEQFQQLKSTYQQTLNAPSSCL